MRDAARLPVHVRLAIANWPEDSPRGAVTAFCARHGISRSWFYEVLALARSQGPLAVASPRSTAPATQAARTPTDVEAVAVAVRAQLIATGFDGGPISVRHAMLERGLPAPSRSTLARIFARLGVAAPSPKKRPKATRRFTYPAPNECWQLDGFDHELADGTLACVLQVIDDHSRRVLASRAAPGERAVDVQAVLAAAIARVGVPRRFLSDNGVALNPSRRGSTGMVESWLRSMGVQVISSTPGHPQTQGKSERHHQTSQRWLAVRPAAASLAGLQLLLDQLEDAYNQRPHQSLGMLTPLQAWAATPVTPPPPLPGPDARAGALTDPDTIEQHATCPKGILHVRMARILLGIEHANSTVLTTTDGNDIHIWDRDGIHLRTVTTIPGTRYYGNGRRPGRPR
ncbi:MAG: DDE-type integrase/transposase/recombinase [Candidatus Nanopelagicales bacterium]